jgi:predicted nuclease with TOPRIM domain
MESRHQDSVSFYKYLEKECNKRIHAHTNCLTFTHAFGKAIESHLDHVVIQKKEINNWLTLFDIPPKDDFANLAQRKVDCEDKIDHLDDTLFMLNRNLKKDNSELKELNKSLSDLLCLIEKEVTDLKANKIKTLKTELEDLKKLFNY